jgi:hypothetical protein
MSSPGRQANLQTVVYEYSLSALVVPAGKRTVDKYGPEG